MKRTNVLPMVIVYVALMIAAIAAFFINYSPTYNITFIRSMCIFAFIISAIGLYRLRKPQ